MVVKMLFDVNKNDGFDIVKMFGSLYYRSFSADTSQPLEILFVYSDYDNGRVALFPGSNWS